MGIGDIAHIDAAMQPVSRHHVGALRETSGHAKHAHGEMRARHRLEHLLRFEFGAMIDAFRPGRRLFIDEGAGPCGNRVPVKRCGAGENQPRHARDHCRLRHHAGSLDIDALEFPVRDDADMRSVERCRMDHRIRLFESRAQERLVRKIADDMGGGKGGAIHADDIVPAGQRTENRAAGPTGTARQHNPHDVASTST
ncbi:hypothetical protein AGR5A_Cc180022 [Agrobacterium genomosp. 5 str. CFBP 6626]|nr:hypothetical protein AGR5A_Cc180022 [Agrobacterium genomosp. 5 str. CFBP 6626]